MGTNETILKSFCADDLLKPVATKQKTIDLVKELIEAIKKGGFRLTRFLSSDEDIVKCVPKSAINKLVQDTLFLENTNEITLGAHWNL